MAISKLNTHSAVSAAATKASLPKSSVTTLLAAFSAGTIGNNSSANVPGANDVVWGAAIAASQAEYVHIYRVAWCSTIPFVILATTAVMFMRGVNDLMIGEVEATVENITVPEGQKLELNTERAVPH